MIIIILIILIILLYFSNIINKEGFNTTCPNGQILVDTTCKQICTSAITTDCVDVSCPTNYTYNSNTSNCEQKSSFDTCSNTQKLINGKCYDPCNIGYMMNPNTGACVQNCPTGYTVDFNDNTCYRVTSFDSCLPTQTLINNKCYDACPSGYSINPNTGACVQNCISGYIMDFSNNTCYLTTKYDTCPSGQTKINDKCYVNCLSGYVMNLNTGSCVQQCTNGYTMNTTDYLCYKTVPYDTCLPEQVKIGSKCFNSCLSGYVMNPNTGTCVQNCISGYIMNFTDNSCYRVNPFDSCSLGQTKIGSSCYINCISGYIMNPNTGACVQQCATGYTMDFSNNSCYQVTSFNSCSVGQTKIGTNCYTNCISGYVMNPNTGVCVQTCASGYIVDFTNNTCSRVTPFDSCLVGQTKIGTNCYTNCISGYVMNPNTGTCVQVCASGYTVDFTNNTCSRVTPFDSCLVGQTKIGTNCYTNCISGYIMNPNTGTCVQVCAPNYTVDFTNNTCSRVTPFDSCLVGQTKIGTKCYTNCISGYVMNPNTGTCVQTCVSGYIIDFSNNTCSKLTSFDTCLSGQTKINDKCYTNCLSGYIMNPNTGACVQNCPTGYMVDFTNNTCSKITPFDDCLVGQTKIGTSCYNNCLSGYIMNPYTGTCVQQCVPDYTMNFTDNTCNRVTSFDTCLTKQTKINSKCYDNCISGYVMNPNTGDCVQLCPPDYTMNFGENTCYKVTPYDICLSGQTKIGSKCFDNCQTGYIMNPNTGVCVQQCESDYTMDFTNNTCNKVTPYDSCLFGQTKIGSNCFNNCISGYIMNPNTGNCVQQCASGYNMNFTDNMCYRVTPFDTCLPEQVKIDSKCFDTCLSGYVMNPNTGSCIQKCDEGYDMNFTNNSCYKVTPFDNCSNNQVLINNKCFNLCSAGYTMNPNTGACIQDCPSGYTIDFNDNTCNKITRFDTCLNGQIKIGNNCFNSCPDGYMINPNTGICVETCPTGYDINFNDNKCYKLVS